MPNGHTHALATTISGSALTTASIAGTILVNPVLVGVAVGAWVGHLCTPDIDHHLITTEERRILRWNKLAGVLWWLYWKLYQSRRPHRGISHTWPRGTAERFVYLLWLPVIVSLLLWPDVFVVVFWCCVFVGQSCQDVIHIAMDRV